MTDIYEAKVFELATSFNHSEQNGKPEAMKQRLAYLSRLAHECQIAEVLRAKEFEFTPDFLAWIETELKRTFTCETSDKSIPTLYNVCTHRSKSIELVFYNIVYCVLERYGVQYRHNLRKRTISFDEFCKLTGNNRKTLSRGETIFYTKNKIQEFWQKDKESGGLLLEIIIKIAKEIERKVK